MATVRTTRQFIDYWLYLSIGAVSAILLTLIGSVFLSRTLVNTTISVLPQQQVTLDAVTFTPQRLGAWRVDTRAQLERNVWATYEVKLLDSQGEVLVSGLKQAWNESGTWQEGAESGSWQEDDLNAGLDVRSPQAESVTVAVELLDLTDTAGNSITSPAPVPFRVTVRSGVIDTRYLWLGLFATGICLGLGISARSKSGKVVLRKWARDSDVSDRVEMGGKNRLLQIAITVRADETSPRQLTGQLWIADGNGQEVFHEDVPIRMSSFYSKGYKDGAVGHCKTYLVCQQPSSYRVTLEVIPDESVDRTDLVVRQGVKTSGAVNVAYI